MEILGLDGFECTDLGWTVKHNFRFLFQQIEVSHYIIDPRFAFRFDYESVCSFLGYLCQKRFGYVSSLQDVV